MQKADGTLFKGQFKDGNPVQGILLSHQEEYTGDFNSDWQKHGYGLCKDPKAQYRGDFVKGQRSGRGIYTKKDGYGEETVIQALWENDLVTMCKMTCNLGSYKGQLNSELEPHGQGKMEYAGSEDVYDRSWVDGKSDGQGIYKSDAFLFDGTFKGGFRTEGS